MKTESINKNKLDKKHYKNYDYKFRILIKSGIVISFQRKLIYHLRLKNIKKEYNNKDYCRKHLTTNYQAR